MSMANKYNMCPYNFNLHDSLEVCCLENVIHGSLCCLCLVCGIKNCAQVLHTCDCIYALVHTHTHKHKHSVTYIYIFLSLLKSVH